MNYELAQPVGIRGTRPRNRWYGPGISVCLARFGTVAAQRRPAVSWDKILGMTTVLVVAALGWATVGLAVSRFLR